MPKKFAQLAPLDLVATSTGGLRTGTGWAHESERADGYRRIARGGMVYVHRAIFEAFRGAIPAGHVVHHRNGDPGDNRLVNLQAMSVSEHSIHHAKRRAKLKRGK